MARPREFDETQAVVAAAEVFRRQGYVATSVDDLVRVTGVHRASLYGTFGSKYGLFLRAIDHVLAGPVHEAGIDLLLIALIELAADNEPLRLRVAAWLDRNHVTATDLGGRLLARAGLRTQTEEGNIP